MNETQGESAAVAPRHLWVIGVLALLWNAMGAFDYVMTETRNEGYLERFTPEQLAFFEGMPAWVIAAWAVAVWGGLAGAGLLLGRRRAAAPVLGVSWAAMVVTSIHNFVLADGAKVMGAGGMAFTAVIFVIALALALYARRMAAAGVLH